MSGIPKNRALASGTRIKGKKKPKPRAFAGTQRYRSAEEIQAEQRRSRQGEDDSEGSQGEEEEVNNQGGQERNRKEDSGDEEDSDQDTKDDDLFVNSNRSQPRGVMPWQPSDDVEGDSKGAAAKPASNPSQKKQQPRPVETSKKPASASDDEDEEDEEDSNNPNAGPEAQSNRREREAVEKELARQRYLALHRAGKTAEAKADLERLAVIRKQREDAAKRREAEKKAKETEKKQAKPGQAGRGRS